MIPILYDSKTEEFQNNGIGLLSDCTRCIVTEERNGAYELEFSYPVTGLLFQYIAPDCYLKAKPNETDQPQLFIIYKVTKPINGIITGYAEHISYQLNDNLVSGGFTASGGAAMVMDRLFKASVLPHKFTAWSDITAVNTLITDEPSSIRSWLGGKEGSILDLWGGEFSYNNYDVKLHKDRGQDIGVVIQYGKNLTDFEQENSISEMYTGIYPYARYTPESEGEAEEVRIELPGKILLCENSGNFSNQRIMAHDFSEDFKEEEITVSKLEDRAKRYMKETGFGIPSVNIKASFVQLWQTTDYEHHQALERIGLCDMVTVRFYGLGIDCKAKVIKTVYDSLSEKYESIELGDAKSNFADTVNDMADISGEIKHETQKQSAWFSKRLAEEIKRATEAITGQTGGHIVLNPSENPREILIMDTSDRTTAVRVWRWNLSGLGYSSHGINGPYELAITADGRIIADFILAGKLEGALLKAGSVSAEALSVEWIKELNDKFTGVVTEVTQLFEAADGKLKSQIEQKITDATGALESKMSEFTQTVDDIQMLFKVIGPDGVQRTGKTRFSANGIEVYDGGIKIYNRYGTQVLYADSSGNLVMNGDIYSTGGSIGGFGIGPASLFSGTSSGAPSKVGLVANPDRDNQGIAFWAGASSGSNIANANLRLKNDGSIYAKYLNSANGIVCNGNITFNNDSGKGSWVYSWDSLNYGGYYGELVTWILCDYTNAPWFLWRDDTRGVTYGVQAAWSSSRRLKKNIADSCELALSVIRKISHRSFDYKSDGSHQTVGYVLEELEEVNPEWVIHRENDYIDQYKLIPYLSKAIQELDGCIADIECAFYDQQEVIQSQNDRIETLETELSDLKALLKEKGVI